MAYRAKTDTWTDKKVKTEGPMILSIDIFYLKTVMIIGGPIMGHVRGVFSKFRLGEPKCTEN